MRRVQPIGRIGLQGIGDIALVSLLRNAVVEHIPYWVGGESEARIARDERGLQGQIALRVLQAYNAVLCNFALILVEVRAWERALSVDREAQGRLQAGLIRDLEFVCGTAENHGHPVLGIEDVLEVAKAVILGRAVMQRSRAPVG